MSVGFIVAVVAIVALWVLVAVLYRKSTVPVNRLNYRKSQAKLENKGKLPKDTMMRLAAETLGAVSFEGRTTVEDDGKSSGVLAALEKVCLWSREETTLDANLKVTVSVVGDSAVVMAQAVSAELKSPRRRMLRLGKKYARNFEAIPSRYVGKFAEEFSKRTKGASTR